MYKPTNKILILLVFVLLSGGQHLTAAPNLTDDKSDYFTIRIMLPDSYDSEHEEDGFLHIKRAYCAVTRHISDPSWQRIEKFIASLPKGRASDLDGNDYSSPALDILHGNLDHSFDSNGNLWSSFVARDPSTNSIIDHYTEFAFLEKEHIAELEEIFLLLAQREVDRINEYYCRLVVNKYNTYRLDGKLEDRTIRRF